MEGVGALMVYANGLLNGVLFALSSFNTVVPVWLGLTILLNAERRTWGVWLAGLGMLITGGFFIFHTAMLDGSILPARFPPWLYAAGLPVIALPLGWYVATLWFAGFWEKSAGRILRLHRFGAIFTGAMAIAMVAVIVAWQPWNETAKSDRADLFFFSTTTPIYVYAGYLLICLFLSIDALRRMEPTGKTIADLARRHARPWLLAISLLQIGVSLIVTYASVWMVHLNQIDAGAGTSAAASGASSGAASAAMAGGNLIARLAQFDLAVSVLIAVSIILIGEAIISYEIFTGKILPRQGLRRHWRNILLLAAGYGTAMSVAIELGVPQLYTLLGTTVVIAVFYALLNWRSYVGRDRYLKHLRPFIGSQQLYERMLSALDRSSPDGGVTIPFHALCSDVLGARLAYLAPLGALAPIAGPAIAYPRGASNAIPWLQSVAHGFTSPATLSVQLDPGSCGGAVWAVPLWSERGLIGALLLGEKLDGGLYTQEEIEIARASGERLIDLQAGTEMARRLVELERQRMAESQVVDARTRRVLHDDLLPQIHSIMLAISAADASGDTSGNATAAGTIEQLGDIHRRISDLLREIPIPAAPAVARLGVIGALRQLADGELRGMFDDIIWSIEPGAERCTITQLAAEVLYYAAREAIRNAARYGRRAAADSPLRLMITADCASGLRLTIEDNGGGIDPERPSNGGAGHGLALHGTMMAVVGGSLILETSPGDFTRIILTLPSSLPANPP